MNQISVAQWNVTFLIVIAVVVALAIATFIICRVILRVVRAESRRIERNWRRQREHDQEVMLAESERLIQATAARRAVLTDALDGLIDEPPSTLSER